MFLGHDRLSMDYADLSTVSLKWKFGVEEFDIDPEDDGEDDDDSDDFTFTNEKEVSITEDGLSLQAVVSVPDVARGVVIFAHGSGSGRYSPRNLYVARALNHAGYATILADLLTDDEASDRMNVFDIDLLASRVTLLARWASAHPKMRNLPVALFGASTGAAAALKAAAQLGDRVQAVISRGGRPDLASDVLGEVHAPTLLIVGSEDTPVVQMNEWAAKQLQITHETKIVDGADHLFEEPGAIEEVALLSRQWLDRFLACHPAWRTTYMRMQQQYII
jgi:putative phosphoribosyl transferase